MTMGKVGFSVSVLPEKFSETVRRLVSPSNKRVIDALSVDLEYYDFGSARWGLDPTGSVIPRAALLRPKRQLNPSHPDANKAGQSQWKLPATGGHTLQSEVT